MAAFEVIALDTATPQLRAPGAGDTYVAPRDMAVSANFSVTGNTTLGDATTDTVQVSGTMGVGGAASASTSIFVRPTALTGANQTGVYTFPTATSEATTELRGVLTFPATAASAFTIGNVIGFKALDAQRGAGSTITNQHGLYVDDQTQGTNNYGITSLVSSGTNKWNIYASGTAANYFAGNVGINTAGVVAPLTIGNLPVTETGSTSYGAVLVRGANYTLSNTQRGTLDIEMSGLGDQNRGATLTFTNNVSHFVQGFDYVAAGLKAGKESSVNITQTAYLSFNTNNNGTLTEKLRLSSTEAVFNDPGNDYDFRVESDTNTHALFVQGSDGVVTVGASSPRTNFAGSFTPGVQLEGTATATQRSLSITSNGSGAGGSPAGLLFGKTRATTIGGTTAVISDDWLCNIGAYGSDGTNQVLATSISAYVDGAVSSGVVPGRLIFSTANSSGTLTERLRITSGGNVSIGGTADRATTVGTAALNIFNGTAPVGTLTNGISIYSSSGEAYVMDATGNATLFSPHDAETNEWIFKSKHTPTGKVLKIDVERLLRFVNDHFGLDAVQEFIEE